MYVYKVIHVTYTRWNNFSIVFDEKLFNTKVPLFFWIELYISFLL